MSGRIGDDVKARWEKWETLAPIAAGPELVEGPFFLLPVVDAATRKGRCFDRGIMSFANTPSSSGEGQ
jgi:hypothetical protein